MMQKRIEVAAILSKTEKPEAPKVPEASMLKKIEVAAISQGSSAVSSEPVRTVVQNPVILEMSAK